MLDALKNCARIKIREESKQSRVDLKKTKWPPFFTEVKAPSKNSYFKTYFIGKLFVVHSFQLLIFILIWKIRICFSFQALLPHFDSSVRANKISLVGLEIQHYTLTYPNSFHCLLWAFFSFKTVAEEQVIRVVFNADLFQLVTLWSWLATSSVCLTNLVFIWISCCSLFCKSLCKISTVAWK